MNPLLQQPFFQVTLPIVLAMTATVWALISTNNRRLDDIRGDLKEIRERMLAIESRLSEFGERLTRLEERASPLARR